MTGAVNAIYMCICRLATLVTFCNYFIRNSFTKTVIKHEVFTMKFIVNILIFYLVSIMNNSTFQVKNIFETTVQHVSAGLFAADATGAVHNNIFGFGILQHIGGHRQLLPESIGRYFYCFFKMAYF